MKLSRRELILLTILAVVLTGFCAYKFAYLPEHERIEGLKAEYAKQMLLYEKAKNGMDTVAEAKRSIEEIQNEIRAMKQGLSTPIRVPEILRELDDTADRTNVTIHAISFSGGAALIKGAIPTDISGQYSVEVLPEPPEKRTDSAGIYDLGISLDFSGKLSDCMNFISYYEQNKRKFIESTFQMSIHGESCTGQLQLRAYSIEKDKPGFTYHS